MPDQKSEDSRRPGSTIPGRRGAKSEQQPDHVVYVVDDDYRVRESLEDLLASC